jgi:hypothetical protein
MSTEDILSEIPIEALHSVGFVKGQLYMPANFVQHWLLPTNIRVRTALKLHAEGKLPGGNKTAMLFFIFDQSVMDLNRPISNNAAEKKHYMQWSIMPKKDDTVPSHKSLK